MQPPPLQTSSSPSLLHATPYRNKKLFTVVRNPYARMVSEFYSPFRGHNGLDKGPTSLNQFLQKKLGELQQGKLVFNGHLIPQAHFTFALETTTTTTAYPITFNRTTYRYSLRPNATAATPQRLVDHILFFEDLQAEFETLMKEYDLPVALSNTTVINAFLPPKNTTGWRKMTFHDLDATTIELINQVHADDFAFLGYRRMDPAAIIDWETYDPRSTMMMQRDEPSASSSRAQS